MWRRGREEWNGTVYLWEAQIRESGNLPGLDHGRVPKLQLWERSPGNRSQWMMAASYDGGWLMRPSSIEAGAFVADLLERLN